MSRRCLKVALIFKIGSRNQVITKDGIIQMRATEQHFPVVLLYYAVQSCPVLGVCELIFKRNHSIGFLNEASYEELLFAIQGLDF